MNEKEEADELLRKGLKSHSFLDIREALENGANLRTLVDKFGMDWTAQHIVG